MIGTLEAKHQELMPDLLMVCQVRGRDSTGVIKVASNNRNDWIKQVGTPDFLTNDPVYRKRITQGLGKALIGHCRHKTVGDANRDNAHPFEHDHITGVHNGTLRSWKTTPDARKFDVDSDWLFWNLSQEGVEKTFSELSHDSAYACIWHNDKEETINFLRNDKRPLWFTWSDDKKVMFWASEIWMLGIVSREKNIDLWEGDKNGNKYFQLPINTLWSFKVDRNYNKNKPSLILKTVKRIQQKEPPKTNFTNTHGNGGGRSFWHRNSSNSQWKKGGEVSDPFLNDSVDDIGGQKNQKELQKKETTPKAVVSPSTKTSEESSSNTPSNVLDFRTGSTRSKNGTKKPLSLPSTYSKTQQSTGKENSCVLSKNKPEKLVSFRNVVGTSYIFDYKTKTEMTVEDFEKKTGGVCCFCKTPIGDEKEVAEFITPTSFLCTSCVQEPNSAVC